MPLRFSQVQVEDQIELPGRAGKPDRYNIVKKHGARVVIQSMVHQEQRRVMTDTQFNDAEFEAIVPELLEEQE